MNNGSWLPEEEEEEEELKGLSANFFDDLIKNIDLPLEEDMETGNDEEEEGDWDAKFENLVPPPLDVLTSLSSEFSHGHGGGASKGQRGRGVQRQRRPVPALKQSSSSEVSSTIDSSLHDVKVSTLFQSSSTVSVLENAANGSASFPVKGTRSKLRKRPTPPTFRSLKSFASEMVQQFAPDDDLDSETYYLPCDNATKKKRQRKNKSDSDIPEAFNADGTIRMCTHCETTKTPQWREGPCGPKTLCNACGVRFRSGRLLPEYRPSSSPSFIPSVHSNSHRKIIEMRMKDKPG